MSVKIVSICSEKFRPLAELTVEKNKRVYCERHGYEMVELLVKETSDRTAGYERIEAILNLMRGNAVLAMLGSGLVRELDAARESQNLLTSIPTNDEWYWAMGVDTMIMNFARRLEEFYDPNFHFIIARDFNGLNADSYLVRNTPEGRCWLEFILSQRQAYEKSLFVEQSVMMDWVGRAPFKDWVKIAPQNGPGGINAYEMALYQVFAPGSAEFEAGQWRPGDFLVHWPGRMLSERMELAASALGRVVGI